MARAIVRKTSFGWQVYAPGPYGHIAQGQPHRTKRLAQKDARQFDIQPPTKLTIPEKHQLKIAYDTLRMSDAGVAVMGGPTKTEARTIITKLTGKTPFEALRNEQMSELHRIKGKGFMPGGKSLRITPKTPRLRR